MINPELSICVLHYNRWDLTKDCLVSIDTQEIPCSYEKVLVDNGSDYPNKLIPLSDLPDSWRLVRYKKNQGHIVGQNRCFESAQGQWVLFVANDVRLNKDCIKYLYQAVKWLGWIIAQPTLFTVVGEVDNRGLNWFWPGYGISVKTKALGPIKSFSSSCYIMNRATWTSRGKFDESLTTSHEDIDFSLGCQKIFGSGMASAIHLGNATLKHQSSHNRKAFHRDRVYVIKKHYQGFDRLLRLTAINLLDSFPRF